LNYGDVTFILQVFDESINERWFVMLLG